MVHRQAQNMILLHISLPLSTNPIANIDSKLDFESNHANCNLSWITVAINELFCMKNAGAQIAMDFS